MQWSQYLQDPDRSNSLELWTFQSKRIRGRKKKTLEVIEFHLKSESVTVLSKVRYIRRGQI
jgi:hypothetical protein